MAQPGSPLLAALNAAIARYPSLDPKAVLGIAAHEGLSGGIGDQGTSFGPFQLHQGGALPANIPLSQGNKWAWSPEGLNYALSRIQGVAGGLKGLPAITAISTRFERPANPQAEIADAARHYGLPAVGGSAFQMPASGAPAMPPMPGAPAPVASHPFASSPIAAALRMLGFPSPGGMGP